MSGNREIDDIEQLIADFEQSDLTELHVRHAGFEIYLSKDPVATGLDSGAKVSVSAVPVANKPLADGAPIAPAAASSSPTSEWPAEAVVVPAPYLGSFYRSPKPGAPAYVEVGQKVSAETELCLVEVMKLFTSVRAGCAGTIHAILATDGEMVEADQPLFVVIPD